MPSGGSKFLPPLPSSTDANARCRTSSYSRSTEGQEFAKDLWEQTMAVYEEQAPGVIILPILLGKFDEPA